MLGALAMDGKAGPAAARPGGRLRDGPAETCRHAPRAPADGVTQPLTAPIVSPFTTYFWKIIVRMIAGAMIATAAAITPPQSTSA